MSSSASGWDKTLGAIASLLTIWTILSTINFYNIFGVYSALALIILAVSSVVVFFFFAYNSGGKWLYVFPLGVAALFLILGILIATAPTPVTIDVKQPSENSSLGYAPVGYAVSVTGTWQNIPSDNQLWLVLWSVNASRYYPQPGPLTLFKTQGDKPSGIWAGIVLCGQQNNSIGEKFIIFPVVANSSAGNYLSDVSQGKIGNWAGLTQLPPGAQAYGSVNVARTH